MKLRTDRNSNSRSHLDLDPGTVKQQLQITYFNINIFNEVTFKQPIQNRFEDTISDLRKQRF